MLRWGRQSKWRETGQRQEVGIQTKLYQNKTGNEHVQTKQIKASPSADWAELQSDTDGYLDLYVLIYEHTHTDMQESTLQKPVLRTKKLRLQNKGE